MRRTVDSRAGLFLVGLALFMASGLAAGAPPTFTASGASATPTPDPLAVPVMPESPTQVDVGRNLYFYHCMPCHGDQGQGLSDAWRQVWPKDHQNCWGRGCHAGRPDDQGFPIPRFIPAVSGPLQPLANFRADQLYSFLIDAHPPQRPGALTQDECWALTAYLLHSNERLAADGRVGPAATGRSATAIGIPVGIILAVLLIGLWAHHPGRAL